MELIGERWSLLIVRELMFGGMRFSDLRVGLPGISAKVLTERLGSLEEAGILQRRQLLPPAATQLYELTEWGYQAEGVIKELGRWAASSVHHDPTLPLSPASFGLSLRTMFDGGGVGEPPISAALHIGSEHFLLEIADGVLWIERGDPEDPDVVLAAPDATPLAAAIYRKLPFIELAAMGLTVSGDEDAARRLVDRFHLPAKVG